MKVDVTRLSQNGFDQVRSSDDVTLPPLNGIPSARTHRTHVTEDGECIGLLPVCLSGLRDFTHKIRYRHFEANMRNMLHTCNYFCVFF